MHPEIFGISACDLESLQDHSTQTSSVSIDRIYRPSSKNSRPPLPRDISKSDKGSITVFEFCQVVQDPESPQDITFIKETVSEETKPHQPPQDNKSTTSSQELTANRYKYCREVIKPYLKHSDCPESEEELLKSAIDSVSEDFPDYQPCFEVFEGEKDISDKTTADSSRRSSVSKGEKDISDKKTADSSRRSSISKVDASTSYTSVMEENKTSEKKNCIPKTKSCEKMKPDCPRPVEECKEPPKIPNDCTPKPKCPKKKEETKKCSPKPSSIVLCDSCPKEPAIGVKCNSPSYYLTERCKDNTSTPIRPSEPEESFLDNHKNTMSTIKVAMEDFVGKVYKSTKDAVTLITTESAKQIDKVKQMKSEYSNTDDAKKTGETKGSETLTSFNFFRKVDSTEKIESGSGSKPELPKLSDVFDNIISKVDSTLSTMSEHINLDNFPDCLKPTNFNSSSSPYDKPAPPRDVSNMVITASVPTSPPTPPPVLQATPVPVSNSVFAAIKDKIVSMFREGELKPTESVSRTSTNSSSSSSSSASKDDNDDHLIDRVIE